MDEGYLQVALKVSIGWSSRWLWSNALDYDIKQPYDQNTQCQNNKKWKPTKVRAAAQRLGSM